jgi:hypothetical protein
MEGAANPLESSVSFLSDDRAESKREIKGLDQIHVILSFKLCRPWPRSVAKLLLPWIVSHCSASMKTLVIFDENAWQRGLTFTSRSRKEKP